MLVFLFRLMSRLPLPVLHSVGVALGWAVYIASASYRRRMKENIARAGFSSHLHAAIGESGKSLMELPFLWCAPLDRVAGSVSIVDWDMALELIDSGRGAIFLTPHLGCFEMLAQKVSTLRPLTVLYRPPRSAMLQPLMEAGRTRPNLTLAPASLKGVRIMLRSLRNGQTIGLLPDQVPQSGEGAWAEFFGRPAYTMTLPARLHELTRAPIMLAYALRRPRGQGYTMHFLPFGHRLDGTPEQQARAINAAMEEVIAQCPEQYFWSYNRYKTPPGVTPPLADQAPASGAQRTAA
ncbi:MAG: lysophospholipid acyltransferase family protein [Herminiimonas sp.]|nr:lysophospholipid acyltransferase family protein [Herminiimonas sp.]